MNGPGSLRPGTHEELRARGIAVPPAYTDVCIAEDPEAPLQGTGRTPRGKIAYFYHPKYVAAQAARKWERVARLHARIGSLAAQIDLRANQQLATLREHGRGRAEALTLRLILQTGMRNGNRAQGLKPSFGASSLLLTHVHLEESRLILDFPGKHGVPQHFELEDPVLAEFVRIRLQAGEDRVFPHTARATLNFLRRFGRDLKVHDLRTWYATQLAEAYRTALCEEDLTTKQLDNAIATAVATSLGNTAGAVRRAYSAPGKEEKEK
jgi:DNA topoisomerase-1